MRIRIGSIAPDFTAETTQGSIRFHEWINDHWCVFFSHPKDFTPVCTTELGSMSQLIPEFNKRHCKVIGLSTDPVSSHLEWSKDIEELAGVQANYPIVGDTDIEISKLYEMLPHDEQVSLEPRTAEQNSTVRNIFLIDPHKIIRLIIVYPMTCGRNFLEILRALDSLQLNLSHQLSTPADWTNGEDVLLPHFWNDEQAREKFPRGWRAPKPYVRFVPQPQ